jgi:hypothetical protein
MYSEVSEQGRQRCLREHGPVLRLRPPRSMEMTLVELEAEGSERQPSSGRIG